MKKNKKKEITKDMTFMEVMNENPDAAFSLMEMGLMCGGCPMAQFETVEQGCEAHGVEVERVIKKLNEEKKESKNGK